MPNSEFRLRTVRASPRAPSSARTATRPATFRDGPNGVGFDSARDDGFFETDMRLSKKLRMRRGHAEVLGEMFNLFNTVNFHNYQGNQSSRPGVTATGIPTGFGRPRQAFLMHSKDRSG
jgi:hypothetical protein